LINNTKLFQIGSFDFRLYHFAVIGILLLSFSISYAIKSQTLDYGNELNEFDPFFNFRATEYMLENGFTEYFQWVDDKSWYVPPEITDKWGIGYTGASGRDVSATSQTMLHITAAITYQIFGGNSNLYDFVILFPAIIVSLTVLVIFALVRLFAGTTSGLISSLLFAVSLPIAIRGMAGWFKSEPLGIFYGLLGIYLFLSGIKSKNKKIAVLKIISAGIMTSFGMASWGGNQFFIIPIGIFILVLPFIRKDHKFLVWSIPLFVISILFTASLFERPGLNFVFGLGGFSLILPTIFLISCIFIQKLSKEKNKTRNGLFLLLAIIIIGSSLIIINEDINLIKLPSYRYLNALNPFMFSIDPLTDSVSEHQSTDLSSSFIFNSIYIIFAGLGIWIILNKKTIQNEIFIKKDMMAFILIFGITGIYISSAFIRLELFASISLIIFASIGLSILSKEIFKINLSSMKNYTFKISYVAIIFVLFTIPLVYPDSGNWISVLDIPPTILTGGTTNPPSTDWFETLEWIKNNTPQDAIIASWWDYGYWITTLSDRITLIDNATLIDSRIKYMAEIFLSSPDQGWNLLHEWNADYVVVFVTSERLANYSNSGERLYVFGKGGDETKSQWFIRIAGLPIQEYLHSDYYTVNNNFLNNTLLGKMIPYTPIAYYDQTTQQSWTEFKPGLIPIYVEDVQYSSDNDPLKLVYSSPSFSSEENGPMNVVLVYKINENYIPSNLQ
jgi:dolichyl-diphosphooligosaccharide---protein glycosyltransferase